MSVGGGEGLHAPVFTKHTLRDANGPREAAQLLPGLVYTADMVACECVCVYGVGGEAGASGT